MNLIETDVERIAAGADFAIDGDQANRLVRYLSVVTGVVKDFDGQRADQAKQLAGLTTKELKQKILDELEGLDD